MVFTGEVTEEKVEKFVASSRGTITNSIKIVTKEHKTLFIVKLKDEAQKWTLIKKAQTISKSIEGLNKIYVNPDLTRSEREIQYHLRQELKRRRALGEKVKISKGRIVQTQT